MFEAEISLASYLMDKEKHPAVALTRLAALGRPSSTSPLNSLHKRIIHYNYFEIALEQMAAKQEVNPDPNPRLEPGKLRKVLTFFEDIEEASLLIKQTTQSKIDFYASLLTTPIDFIEMCKSAMTIREATDKLNYILTLLLQINFDSIHLMQEIACFELCILEERYVNAKIRTQLKELLKYHAAGRNKNTKESTGIDNNGSINFFDSANIVLFVQAAHGNVKVCMASENAGSFFNCPDSLIGTELGTFVPEVVCPRHDEMIVQFAEGEKRKGEKNGFKTVARIPTKSSSQTTFFRGVQVLPQLDYRLEGGVFVAGLIYARTTSSDILLYSGSAGSLIGLSKLGHVVLGQEGSKAENEGGVSPSLSLVLPRTLPVIYYKKVQKSLEKMFERNDLSSLEKDITQDQSSEEDNNTNGSTKKNTVDENYGGMKDTLLLALGRSVELESLFLPYNLLDKFTSEDARYKLKKCVEEIESSAADRRFETNDKDGMDRLESRLIKAFMKVWLKDVRDLQHIFAILGSVEKVRFSMCQLWTSTTAPLHWEIKILSRSKLDLPTTQIIRAIVSHGVGSLGGFLVFSPRALSAIGRMVSLEIATSHIGPTYRRLFARTKTVLGTARGRTQSQGRIYPPDVRVRTAAPLDDSKDGMRFYTIKTGISGMDPDNSLGIKLKKSGESEDFVRNTLFESPSQKSIKVAIMKLPRYAGNPNTLNPGNTTYKDLASRSNTPKLNASSIGNIMSALDRPVGSQISVISAIKVSGISKHRTEHTKSKSRKYVAMARKALTTLQSKGNTEVVYRERRMKRSQSACPPLDPALMKKLAQSAVKLGEIQPQSALLEKFFEKATSVVHKQLFSGSKAFWSQCQSFPDYTEVPYVRQRANNILRNKSKTIKIDNYFVSGIGTSELDIRNNRGKSPKERAKDDEVGFGVETSIARTSVQMSTEKIEAQFIRKVLHRPSGQKRAILFWDLLFTFSIISLLVVKMILEDRYYNAVDSALQQNDRVLLLTQVLCPTATIYRESIKKYLMNAKGVSLPANVDPMAEILIEINELKDWTYSLTTNYTDMRTTYNLNIAGGRLY